MNWMDKLYIDHVNLTLVFWKKIEGKTLIIDCSYLEIKYRKRANQSISSPPHHPRTKETIMPTMTLHIIHYITD